MRVSAGRSWALLLTLAAPPVQGAPRDHALLRLAQRERRAVLGPALPLWRAPADPAARVDFIHADQALQLDARGDVVAATLDVRLRGVGRPLSSFAFYFDEGLRVTAVSAPQRRAQAVQQRSAPYQVVVVTLTPAVPAGEEAVVHVEYQGALLCGAAEGIPLCSKGGDFGYFATQSLFANLFDDQAAADARYDGMTRRLTLRVPAGLDVIATGDRVSQGTEGALAVSTWAIDKPLARGLGLYAFVGRLGLLPVGGRAAPTTLLFPLPRSPNEDLLLRWSPGALAFAERMAGQALPFDRWQTLVRLPAALQDPGTATYGMTVLSDHYAAQGELWYEETWAHENAHLFWGIAVPECDAAESRLLSEGLATLSEIDYTRAARFPREDRDGYLARRFRAIGLDLRYLPAAAGLPPVQSAGGKGVAGLSAEQYTLWAYEKSAATLDQLRVTVGDDVFAAGLQGYARACQWAGCCPDDLRVALEGAGAGDLRPFFDRFVTGSGRPRVTLGFRPVAGGAEVRAGKDDEAPLALALQLRLLDGRVQERRVLLGGRSSALRVEAPAAVVAVSANPRHEGLVELRSEVEGDLDFDGETDGLDVLACARRVGQAYEPGFGLWRLDGGFDARCDGDGDGVIEEEDLARVAARFGAVRAP